MRKSRYWGETLQFPHPLLWRNEASLLVQWHSMYFPLALWTLFVYIVCYRRTGQCFSVLRIRTQTSYCCRGQQQWEKLRHRAVAQCATLAHPWTRLTYRHTTQTKVKREVFGRQWHHTIQITSHDNKPRSETGKFPSSRAANISLENIQIVDASITGWSQNLYYATSIVGRQYIKFFKEPGGLLSLLDKIYYIIILSVDVCLCAACV